MKNSKINLYVEINNLRIIFFAVKHDEQNNLNIIYKLDVPIKGIDNDRIINFEQILEIIKKNIYFIEQELNYTFRETILILENFTPQFINISGYRKLNGSQILKENISYILNILKSYISEIEIKKKIIHIFNSSFYLDKKRINNLPIGLFGDFYSHELSFILIKTNDYKNLKNIFEKCNLKIKKILLKSFIKGTYLSDNNLDAETFFHIKINKNSSKIFYFENRSLKFEQYFNFGWQIIITDVSKVTSLKEDIIKNIINKIDFSKNISNDDIVEDEYFENNSYVKIKKKLIYEVIFARIKEISEILLLKNINFEYYNRSSKLIFIESDDNTQLQCLKDVYQKAFSVDATTNIKFLNNFLNDDLLTTADRLVQFGWEKEAIPITDAKKSLLARFFDAIFA